MKSFEPHDSYTAMKPVWRKCRDAATGQRAIHAGKEYYLPKLSGQEDRAYDAYVNRALFFNATGRTIDAMAGLIFRKQPQIEIPSGMEEWKQDIDLAGKTLEGFASEAVEEVIKVARGGILVDHPQQVEGATVEQANRLSLRPYMTLFKAEDILDWRVERIDNVSKVSYVVLSEIADDDVNQIRELSLEEGVYIQRVYQELESGWELIEEIEPKKQGAKLNEIPFFFLAPKEAGIEIQDPPIEDLVYVNLSHYQNSADLENGAHVSGLPTPYVTGITDEEFTFMLGGSGIALPMDATAGFLQCGSEGFATLEKLMDRKEEQMASLGARAISPEKRMAETAETQTIKRGGENSVLASIAGSVEQQIRKALEFMRDWAGYTGDVLFELNKDYIPSTMSAQELTALLGAVQSGQLSQQSFFEALQRGEVISEGVTFEDEQDRIQASGVSFADVE